MRRKAAKAQSIYVIHNCEFNIVKIGISENCELRLKSLICASGCKLNLVYSSFPIIDAEKYEKL